MGGNQEVWTLHTLMGATFSARIHGYCGPDFGMGKATVFSQGQLDWVERRWRVDGLVDTVESLLWPQAW